MMSRLRRFFDRLRKRQLDASPSGGDAPDLRSIVTALQAGARNLEDRLRQSEERLRERSEMLYELQRQYSAEHFGFQESLRNLKIERMRNAGIFADRDILLSRARSLQSRIAELKERLRKYEPVEDQAFDQQPIAIEVRSPEAP